MVSRWAGVSAEAAACIFAHAGEIGHVPVNGSATGIAGTEVRKCAVHPCGQDDEQDLPRLQAEAHSRPNREAENLHHVA